VYNLRKQTSWYSTLVIWLFLTASYSCLGISDTRLEGVILMSRIYLVMQGVGGGTLPVTARTLETIIRLSAAHAKLKLRNQVPKLKLISAGLRIRLLPPMHVLRMSRSIQGLLW
jgi:hypothetical protein